jgi:hypothetical protein
MAVLGIHADPRLRRRRLVSANVRTVDVLIDERTILSGAASAGCETLIVDTSCGRVISYFGGA